MRSLEKICLLLIPVRYRLFDHCVESEDLYVSFPGGVFPIGGYVRENKVSQAPLYCFYNVIACCRGPYLGEYMKRSRNIMKVYRGMQIP